MDPYGKELILDLHDCDSSKFNRKDITTYFEELCKLIGMQREDLHFWDYEDDPEEYKKAPPHLKGTSAIQFIQTSSIVIHTLDDLGKIFINIFSCKDLFPAAVKMLTETWFKGKVINNKGDGYFVERI